MFHPVNLTIRSSFIIFILLSILNLLLLFYLFCFIFAYRKCDYINLKFWIGREGFVNDHEYPRMPVKVH